MAIVGIDLGTTNSLAAVYKDGRAQLVPNQFGEFLTPSVVSVDKDGRAVVGRIAQERLVTQPQDTVARFKRKMGTDAVYNLGGRRFTPEALSACVIGQLVADAQEFLGECVDEAVVSVPAYFDVAQRAATKRAGALAGVRVERLVNEPSAAALGHHFSSEGAVAAAAADGYPPDETFCVFDFGGGTLDVSVVDCFDNVVGISAVAGDNHLGGGDFDLLIAQEACRINGISLNALGASRRETLLREAERAKRELADRDSHAFLRSSIPALPQVLHLTNKGLFELAEPLFTRIERPLKQAVYDSDVPAEEISRAVLVGGSSRMPVVRDYLERLLAVPVTCEEDCDVAVALGLGTYVGIKQRARGVDSLVLTDICPHSLSTDVRNPHPPFEPLASVLIPRNTTLPASSSQVYANSQVGAREARVAVYQGENMYVQDNKQLAEIMVPLPRNNKSHEPFTVTFTYDINSILGVEVRVHSTGEVTRRVYNGSSWDEGEDALATLQEVQLSARMEPARVDAELALERALRVAAEGSDYVRDYLRVLTCDFASSLNSNSLKLLITKTRQLNAVLDRIEADKADNAFFRHGDEGDCGEPGGPGDSSGNEAGDGSHGLDDGLDEERL